MNIGQTVVVIQSLLVMRLVPLTLSKQGDLYTVWFPGTMKLDRGPGQP